VIGGVDVATVAWDEDASDWVWTFIDSSYDIDGDGVPGVTLEADEEIELQLIISVPTGTEAGKESVHTLTAKGVISESVKTVTDDIQVLAPALSIILTPGNPADLTFNEPDDSVTFTVTVENNGTTPAYNSKVIITIPDGL